MGNLKQYWFLLRVFSSDGFTAHFLAFSHVLHNSQWSKARFQVQVLFCLLSRIWVEKRLSKEKQPFLILRLHLHLPQPHCPSQQPSAPLQLTFLNPWASNPTQSARWNTRSAVLTSAKTDRSETARKLFSLAAQISCDRSFIK